MCVTGPNLSGTAVKQGPEMAARATSGNELSFRDEGKLCRACLKGTKAVTPARAAARILSLEALLAAVASALGPF